MNKLINVYLTAAETMLLMVGAAFMIFGGLLCDGPMFDQAIKLEYFGVATLAGGAICQMLKELPRR